VPNRQLNKDELALAKLLLDEIRDRLKILGGEVENFFSRIVARWSRNSDTTNGASRSQGPNSRY
jgi:hypothetical protein